MFSGFAFFGDYFNAVYIFFYGSGVFPGARVQVYDRGSSIDYVVFFLVS